ncbi:MAG: DUF3179 domain-containing protein [bacterium]|nr:DUF3179 domain-containing protein [bacterium]
MRSGTNRRSDSLLRVLVLLGALAILAGACGGSEDAAPDPTTTTRFVPEAPETDEPPPNADGEVLPGRAPLPDSSGREAVPSALADRFWPGFAALIPPDQIRSGGPPPDGIPALDEPVLAPTAEIDFLADSEAVLALEIDGDSRAYPLQIMTWHELVNDTVGGVPVTISYCPLCNSSVAYDRNAAGRVLDFGTSGMLYQSSLVMYDRQTQSLWTHFDGLAVIGELIGTQLDFWPMAIVSWAAWRDEHPDGMVLTQETGYHRNYGRNPYVGYETSERLLTPAFQSTDIDERLPAKERVVGIRGGGDAVAVRHAHLTGSGVVEVELAGVPLVVWNLPGASSAIDAPELANGIDVGSSGVFERTLDGRLLSFSRSDDGFRDSETDSTWNLFGEATAGELAGSRLQPREFVDTFWFAWGTFEPDSSIVPPLG